MARLEGTLKLRGKLGALSFYEDKDTGGTLVKESKGGHTSESLKTDPNKKKIRQNNLEFEMITKTQSLLMLLVRHQFGTKLPRSVNSKFATLMHLIKKQDAVHALGERKVSTGLRTATGKQALIDFLFSPDQGIYSLFGGLPRVISEGKRCCFTGLSLPVDRFPDSATHVELRYFVVDYDSALYEVRPYYADKVVVSKEDFNGTIADLELPELGTVGDFRVAYLYVQFYQFHEGVRIELTGEGMKGLRCLGVFTS